MNVEAINVQNSAQSQLSKAADQVSAGRKQKEHLVQSEMVEKNQVPPEELLKQIKALTEEGLYSVRFEHDERSSGMVVKIFSQESNEVIRQLPAEELLDLKSALADLRGNIVNTQS